MYAWSFKIKVQANQSFDLVRESIIEGAKRRKQICCLASVFFNHALEVAETSPHPLCTPSNQAVGFERESIRSLVKVAGR